MSGAAPEFCRNCAAPLTGAYCAACGQRADVHLPSTVELLHEALEGITHSDSRLWRSLRMLVLAPGALTREFIAGKRVAFLPPFRLYLVLSVLFFVVAGIHEPVEVETSLAKPGTANQCWLAHIAIPGLPAARMQSACEKIAHDNGQGLLHAALETMPKAMFVFLPLIAFLHMLLYWRPRHRYAEHLLFFLHLHAFAFLALTVLTSIGRIGERWPALEGGTDLATTGIILYMPAYTLIAIRRVFERSWFNTVCKGLVLVLIYSIALAATIAGVFLYAVLRL